MYHFQIKAMSRCIKNITCGKNGADSLGIISPSQYIVHEILRFVRGFRAEKKLPVVSKFHSFLVFADFPLLSFVFLLSFLPRYHKPDTSYFSCGPDAAIEKMFLIFRSRNFETDCLCFARNELVFSRSMLQGIRYFTWGITSLQSLFLLRHYEDETIFLEIIAQGV